MQLSGLCFLSLVWGRDIGWTQSKGGRKAWQTEVDEGEGQGEEVKGPPGGLTRAGFSAGMMPTGGVEKT